ncbi:efflux RND transporter periplasmic adaptor subunit [Methyloglobulus sp.]|uniref:efflux RND transporter periplasmic adaptor subunit n=1 Tax=Methyloglobulus sp. TaxID=2518622 RepID=UPI0032B79529
MIKRFALIIFLSLLLFGGLFGWKFFQISQAIKNIPVQPPAVVAATIVQLDEWQSSLSAVGSLVAVAGIDVSSEVAGKVKAIHFESGQLVRRGHLLVELDSSTDAAELAGLEASQRLEQAKFARSQQLIRRNFISKSDYDLNKATLDEAKAVVAAKKSAIEKKRIVAPFDGQIGIRKVNVGQYLAPGDAIAPLQQLQPIYADFALPEQHLASLKVNQELTLTVRAYPDKSFNGHITAINSGIDVATRSVKIRATLNNAEHLLHPGMFVDVQLFSSEQKTVLTVPDTAISYNPYGDSVFVIESSKQGLTVKLKQIVTGETRKGRVEIVKGLNENEKVVSAGQVKLRNGMPVVLDKLPAPGERGTAP